jgi:hypothetical protein
MTYRDAALGHLASFFHGHPPAKQERWDLGPMASVEDFCVARIAPGPKSSLWTYCSVGASVASTDSQRLEFFALSPRQDARLVELVTMVAHYHRTEKLGPFHMFPIGQPWLDDASCDAFLVSLPYLFGTALERLDAESNSARFLWLLPITEAERQFAKNHGVDALEERFDQAKLEYWDLARRSVA